MGSSVLVRGAGLEDVNGTYLASVLLSYTGRTIYRKPETLFYIYRWRRTQWIIAELQEHAEVGDEQAWLYRCCTRSSLELPPSGGWEPAARRSIRPAPELVLSEPSVSFGVSFSVHDSAHQSSSGLLAASEDNVSMRKRGERHTEGSSCLAFAWFLFARLVPFALGDCIRP